MSANYKPAGYNSVTPYLIVPAAAACVDFLVKAFGAVEIRRVTDDKKHIVHAEIRLDDSVLMLAERSDSWPAVEAHVHVYVPDVDKVYACALKLGATSVQAPIKKDDDDKRGGV